MSSVGIIANPLAGKDIRRLVSQANVVSNQEKANTLRRVFSGLLTMGVKKIFVMPDITDLTREAREDVQGKIDIELLEIGRIDQTGTSTIAAELMEQNNVDCIITLGGDGTNRAVAKAIKKIPLLPISTGTNNVFPFFIEGTIAGIAAGSYAVRKTEKTEFLLKSKKFEVLINDKLEELALIDIAIVNIPFLGSGAVWDTINIEELFLTRSEGMNIGLSSIGAQIKQLGALDKNGLHLIFDNKNSKNSQILVNSPIAPGKIIQSKINQWKELVPGEMVKIRKEFRTIALDGERTIEIGSNDKIEISLSSNGPLVLDVKKILSKTNIFNIQKKNKYL